MTRTIHNNFDETDLIVDAIYEGGRKGNASDDPLPQLIGVSNQGGFRYLGRRNSLNLVVLTTSLDDPNWPDEFDPISGIFTYYGDNKLPGRELHDTPRFGNQILRDLFALLHGPADNRKAFPPILLFSKTGIYRDVKFIGLAVPGARNLSQNEDLVAIWKVFSGLRFQNYRAKFTVLDVPCISRSWLHDMKNGTALTSKHCPEVWHKWVTDCLYSPLITIPSIEHRSKHEQLPDNEEGWQIIKLLCDTFSKNPYAFEKCGAEIVRMILPNVSSIDLTRPSRDGGRDAIGRYRLGNSRSSIEVDFAMEAKCYNPETSSVGVKETSRLISRLRHRQFGVFITTSYINTQAYKEIKEDEHPVIIIAGRDIVDTLRKEFPDTSQLQKWLALFT